MTKKLIAWEIASNFEVISPQGLHDSELGKMAMSLDRVTLTFKNVGTWPPGESPVDPSTGFIRRDVPMVETSTIWLECGEPKLVLFQSFHLQNVVEAIHIFSKETVNLAPDTLYYLPFPHLFDEMMSSDCAFYVFLSSSAGTDLFIAANEVLFYEQRHDD